MHSLGLTLLLLASSTAPAAKDLLQEEQSIAAQFQSEAQIPEIAFKLTPAPVHIDTTPMISYTDRNGVHEAIFKELPPSIQGIFDRWAGFTADQTSGASLFDDMFHKFFFVHELAHWTSGDILEGRTDAGKERAIVNDRKNHWNAELEMNRLAVAWWREHDPSFLGKFVDDCRSIRAALPNPVPVGTDMKSYFAENYEKLGQEPNAYGWFLLQSVILAYDEPPESFQQAMAGLLYYNF